MANTTENLRNLINLTRLGNFFDELMKNELLIGATKVNVNLKEYVITVTDRYGHTSSMNIKGDKGVKGDKGDRGPQGVKGDPGYEIHLEDMTEAEKQELKELLEDGLVFASVETCESVINELT